MRNVRRIQVSTAAMSSIAILLAAAAMIKGQLFVAAQTSPTVMTTRPTVPATAVTASSTQKNASISSNGSAAAFGGTMKLSTATSSTASTTIGMVGSTSTLPPQALSTAALSTSTPSASTTRSSTRLMTSPSGFPSTKTVSSLTATSLPQTRPPTSPTAAIVSTTSPTAAFMSVTSSSAAIVPTTSSAAAVMSTTKSSASTFAPDPFSSKPTLLATSRPTSEALPRSNASPPSGSAAATALPVAVSKTKLTTSESTAKYTTPKSSASQVAISMTKLITPLATTARATTRAATPGSTSKSTAGSSKYTQSALSGAQPLSVMSLLFNAAADSATASAADTSPTQAATAAGAAATGDGASSAGTAGIAYGAPTVYSMIPNQVFVGQPFTMTCGVSNGSLIRVSIISSSGDAVSSCNISQAATARVAAYGSFLKYIDVNASLPSCPSTFGWQSSYLVSFVFGTADQALPDGYYRCSVDYLRETTVSTAAESSYYAMVVYVPPVAVSFTNQTLLFNEDSPSIINCTTYAKPPGDLSFTVSCSGCSYDSIVKIPSPVDAFTPIGSSNLVVYLRAALQWNGAIVTCSVTNHRIYANSVSATVTIKAKPAALVTAAAVENPSAGSASPSPFKTIYVCLGAFYIRLSIARRG